LEQSPLSYLWHHTVALNTQIWLYEQFSQWSLTATMKRSR
jgi:hypothetical protein